MMLTIWVLSLCLQNIN